MPHIGVIADDLTGATTTGVLLARSGAKLLCFLMWKQPKQTLTAHRLMLY